MKKKTMALISSCAAIAVCSSLIVGSTYALFTSESEVDITVKSGKVDVVATVGNLTKNLYEGTAILSNEDKTLTVENMVPKDSVSFDIKVVNNSTVTVNYRTVLYVSSDDGLFDGLEVTFNDEEANYTGEKITSNVNTLAVGENPEDITVKISLPEEAGNAYQGKTCTITYAVEAVQGNGYFVEKVSTADELKKIFETGGTAALNNDVDFGGETVAIKEDVKLVGNNAKISNATLQVASGKDAEFEGVNLSGATSVYVAGTGSALTFKNCTFEITPKKIGNNNNSAIVGTAQGNTLDLVLDSCTFNYKYEGTTDELLRNLAVFMWSSVNNVSIKNCTFNDYGFVAVKLMNVIEGANILIEGNTFNMSHKGDANWYYNSAIQICPQHDRAFTVTFKNNTFTGDYETVEDSDVAEFAGNTNTSVAEVVWLVSRDLIKPLTKATVVFEGNTLNGEDITIDNVAFRAENN